jgi:predicted dehydrogenase
MPQLTRRGFLKTTSLAVGATALSARSWSQVSGANNSIRMAIAGLNGRGKELARDFRAMPGVRVVALCDVDRAILDRELDVARKAGDAPDAVIDYRELLPRRDIDVIAIATPNHHHAWQSIWAMEAGKDVLHEKPAHHSLWEGAQLLAAQKKYRRIVQVNTQNRSSAAIAEALAWMKAGHLGRVTAVHGIVYKRRLSIGKTDGPVAPPATVNYDLFQGPAPLVPLRRKTFHYDWHWQWATGNGDMVAQGNHQLDVGRRFLGDPGHPRGVMTVGGRFGYEDDGETPNTFLVYYDYGAVPFIFEVRGLPAKPDEMSGNVYVPGGLGSSGRFSETMDSYRGLHIGNVVDCEGGYLTIPSNDYSLAQACDRDGKLRREFRGGQNHHANFIAAVRSRKESELNCPLLQGHLSSTLVHLANISHRTGRRLPPGEIREHVAHSELAEPFGRFEDHLARNNVDLAKTPAQFGAPLAFDGATERFTGENAAAANSLRRREYRAPWIVPELA